MIYDGDCGFCRWSASRWRRLTGERVDYEPSQRVAIRFPEIPSEQFARSVVFIGPDGVYTTGAEAMFCALAEAPGRAWPLRLYRAVPPIAWLAEASYGLVARHRKFFSWLTRPLQRREKN